MTIRLGNVNYDLPDVPTVDLYLSVAAVETDTTLPEACQAVDHMARTLAAALNLKPEDVRARPLPEVREAYLTMMTGWTANSEPDPKSAASGDSPTS